MEIKNNDFVELFNDEIVQVKIADTGMGDALPTMFTFSKYEKSSFDDKLSSTGYWITIEQIKRVVPVENVRRTEDGNYILKTKE